MVAAREAPTALAARVVVVRIDSGLTDVLARSSVYEPERR
jgi:hypothetical protein